MDWTLYGLSRVNKQLTFSNKKLLYSGLIHSHLVYRLPIWGFSTRGRLLTLLTKQKKAIRKIFNLQYREHTLPFFGGIHTPPPRTNQAHDNVLHAFWPLKAFTSPHLRTVEGKRTIQRKSQR